MLQGEALRRRGKRSSPLQACFDFATSLFGLVAHASRVLAIASLAIADFSVKTVSARDAETTRETHALPEQERTLNPQQRIVIGAPQALATPYDMSAYVIVKSNHRSVGYEEYKKLAGSTVSSTAVNILWRGGACETLEGDWNPKRIVILQFENIHAPKPGSIAGSPNAQNAHSTAKTRMIVVEGCSL